MPADSLLGRKIDDFVIEERLGQGAMAVVYKAFQPSINRHVALKVIRLDEGQTEEFRKRFAREAEVIARLEHIHILPIYAYGVDEEMAYLAMRWLRGGSLSELLRGQGVSLDRAADLFKQIAQGLGYAHSKGIIHRDLKPSNIMLDDAGNAYLTDFGLAKLAEGSGEITKSGTIVGTPAYMSPEQLRGEPLDHRSDIYSLGVILYNMVVGRLPFDTTTSDLVSIIYQHLEKPPTPPREINPDIPADVEAVIMRALQKNREERFSTATDMARALNLALGRPIGSSDSLNAMPAPRFVATPSTATRQAAAKSWLPYGAAILGVLILVAIGALLVSQTNSANAALAAAQTADYQTETALQAALAQTEAAAEFTPTPVPAATILTGERASSQTIIPDSDEIKAARAKMGPNGFIAYIACNQDSEFHAALARETKDLATSNSIAIQIYDSENDPYKQITLIERARTEGASAFIICPLDNNLLNTTLLSVQEAGIPMVFFADKINTYGGVLVGGDNYLLGLEPGRYAGQLIRDEMGGKADVVILDYPNLEYIVSRANGLEDGVKESAPQAHILGRYLGATRENGKAAIEQLIADGTHFDVILSINDAGAFGAIEAMEAAGMDPKSVIITSVDAEALAQQYILTDYYIRGSVESSRDQNAQAIFNAAIKLLAGATLPEFLMVPPGHLITKALLEEEGTPVP